MKARLSISVLVLLLTFLSPHASSSNAKLNFEKALLLEEASGQLQEAIALYQKVLTEATGDEALAAQAQLHVGMCYEKLAREEARKAYQTVVDRYPSQQEPVRIARQRLASLRSGHQVGQTVTVREFMRSGETSSDKISDPTIDASEFVTTRDGQTFVYTDWMTGDLVVKNFSTGKTQALYNVNWYKSEEEFFSPVLSPDEKRVVYLNHSWANGQNVTRLGVDSVQGGNRGLLYESKTLLSPHDWSPDGNKILASLEADDRSVSLVTVGTINKKMQRLVTLNWEYPRRAEYSPDGRFIAYDSTKDGDRRIYLMASDGLQERLLADSPGENDSPLWTRDGRFLLFRSSRSGQWDLFALPMKGSQPAGDPILIKPNIGEATSLRSITDDGKLFYGEETGGQDIAIVERGENRSVKGARILPRVGTRANGSPRFSPDGKSLAYIAGRYQDQRQMLRIASLEGKVVKEVPLTPDFRPIFSPAFSPNGSKIALGVRDLKKQTKVLVISAETGTILKRFVPLTQQGAIYVAGWSGDGRYFYAWIRNTEKAEKDSLATINVETEETVFTPLPKKVNLPKVSPDGNYLIMAVQNDSAPGQDHKYDVVLRVLSDGNERLIKEAVSRPVVVWDYDSRHIFYKKKDDERRIYRCSIDAGVEEVFLEDAERFSVPYASFDAKHIAFQTGFGDSRIWLVENFLPKAKPELAAR
jgi:Tol biopolymer transport system component